MNSKKPSASNNLPPIAGDKKMGLASIMDETTPEEEERTLEYIYNRPSPPHADDFAPIMDSEKVGL